MIILDKRTGRGERRMNEEYKKQSMEYCPRCGQIGGSLIKCPSCRQSQMFTINPKWNITNGVWDEMYNEVRYGEITEEEFDRRWDEYCRPFTEEVIMKHPDFSQEAYDQRMADRYPSEEELARRERVNNMMKKYEEKEKRKNPHGVKCPYCSSTNTKKLSSMSRMFSGGLFGLGSGKIGKQWHCNSCGSD